MPPESNANDKPSCFAKSAGAESPLPLAGEVEAARCFGRGRGRFVRHGLRLYHPHPSLRATFSREREKEKREQFRPF
jgi:hypothetical protein